MTNEEKLLAIIYLLEQEVECLRSVLSEYDEDKSHFVQMICADNFSRALLSLKFPYKEKRKNDTI